MFNDDTKQGRHSMNSNRISTNDLPFQSNLSSNFYPEQNFKNLTQFKNQLAQNRFTPQDSRGRYLLHRQREEETKSLNSFDALKMPNTL